MGCYLGSESSCYFAGKAIVDGKVTPSVDDSTNNQLAAKYFQMACNIGETSFGNEACKLSEKIKLYDSNKVQKTIDDEFDISKNGSKLEAECSDKTRFACYFITA